MAQDQGDASRAETWFKQGLTLAAEIESKYHIASNLAVLAGPAADLGQLERAARLIGAAEALYDAQGLAPQPGDLQAYERSQATVREQLDEAAFETAWAEGQAMSLEEAVAYALEGFE